MQYCLMTSIALNALVSSEMSSGDSEKKAVNLSKSCRPLHAAVAAQRNKRPL